MINNAASSIPLYQRYSLYLATVEVTLGAMLHGARIPFTGYILSLHQAFCLARASRHDGSLFTPVCVSTTVAILKTLSPMGKRLTPMLAIMIQGFLFNIGMLCFGNNIAGHMFGAILLSFWGFIQPALFAYLIFGQDLLSGLSTFEQLINQYLPGFSLLIVIISIVSLKAMLAVCAVILAKSSLPIETLIYNKLSSSQNILQQSLARKNRTILLSLFKDLTSFWFLFSFCTVCVFAWWRDDPFMQTFLTMTTYLAYSIILFIVLRLVNLQQLAFYLDRIGLYKISSNLQGAFNAMTIDNKKGTAHDNNNI